jgi:hypothetical protein
MIWRDYNVDHLFERFFDHIAAEAGIESDTRIGVVFLDAAHRDNAVKRVATVKDRSTVDRSAEIIDETAGECRTTK